MAIFKELTFEERDRIGDAICGACDNEIGIGDLHVHEDGDHLLCAPCYESEQVDIANDLTARLARANALLSCIRQEYDGR